MTQNKDRIEELFKKAHKDKPMYELKYPSELSEMKVQFYARPTIGINTAKCSNKPEDK
jgi:hypothetical protein